MGGCCARPTTQIETSKQKPIPQEVKLKSSVYVDEDKPWLKIEVPQKIKILLHKHELEAMPNTDNDEWMCNGHVLFKTGCHSGINAYHQTMGVQGWTCPVPPPHPDDEGCDFDICKTCIQYVMHAERQAVKQKLTIK